MEIMILGMHRSGTSLVSSILIDLGVLMGTNLLPADKGNPNGYFEDRDFLELNKEILGRISYKQWASTEATRKAVLAEKHNFARQMKRLTRKRRKEANGRSWGWKDPRNTMTVWLWHSLLKEPSYIVCRREGEAVAKSMQKLRGGRVADYLYLRKHYHSHIDAFTRAEEPRLMEVHFEELVHPDLSRMQVERLADFIGADSSLVSKAARRIELRRR